MITKSCLSFTAISATFIFLIYAADNASALGRGGARGGGSEPYAVGGQHTGGSQAYGGQPYASGIKIARKGGGGRGGGGRGGARGGKSRGGGAHAGKSRGGGYSRSGSAKSGSFSSGSKRASQPSHKRTASSAPRKSSPSGAKQNRKKSPNENNVQARQDGKTDRTKARQDGATDRNQARQSTKNYAIASQNNYYGGRYYHDDWDNGDTAAVVGAAALGYAVGQSNAQNTAPSTTTVIYSDSSGSGGLPCNPNTAVVNKVTYYQCGNDWYVQGYGESGVIYMPVPNPY